MGTGICLFFTGKMGFGSLALGITDKQKNNEKWEWDLSKTWAGKWDL